jgi:hypothetical protein
VSATEERIGRNQALFREVNERIKDVSATLDVGDSSGIEFVCECSRTECHASVSLQLSGYERIRRHPARFLVAIGHLWTPEAERLVENTTHTGWWRSSATPARQPRSPTRAPETRKPRCAGLCERLRGKDSNLDYLIQRRFPAMKARIAGCREVASDAVLHALRVTIVLPP